MLSPRPALARLGRLAMTTRREWSEFQRRVVFIEHEIDAAKKTAVNELPSREHFSVQMLDILFTDGASPHRRQSVAPFFIVPIRAELPLTKSLRDSSTNR